MYAHMHMAVIVDMYVATCHTPASLQGCFWSHVACTTVSHSTVLLEIGKILRLIFLLAPGATGRGSLNSGPVLLLIVLDGQPCRQR